MDWKVGMVLGFKDFPRYERIVATWEIIKVRNHPCSHDGKYKYIDMKPLWCESDSRSPDECSILTKLNMTLDGEFECEQLEILKGK